MDLKMKQMNKLDTDYQTLLQDILDNGVTKQDRTGTGTISVFGRQIRHNMKDGFPLLTTKKMAWKQIVTELLWFLKGDTNIKFLVDNDCHIWDGDAYKNYRMNVQEYEKLPNSNDVKSMKMILDSQGNSHPFSVPFNKEEFINKIKTDDEFAKKWGELGPIYGAQWRGWDKYNDYVDQIANLISELKTNPDSRRLMVSAWNVGELDQMVLPPCHFSFQCYSHEENGKRYLSLAWNQRSVDTFLGLPFNIASYGLLLEIIAKEVNMVPDELIGNLGDVHLYNNHIEQAKEQIGREPYTLPKLVINDEFWNPDAGLIEQIEHIEISDFEIRDYQSHPTVKAPLSN
jgi:thymidylate synthase